MGTVNSVRGNEMALSLSEAFAPAETPVAEMEDRQLLEEIAANQRKILTLFGGVMRAASQHPVVNMMLTQQGIVP
jgi:hypothetical protein